MAMIGYRCDKCGGNIFRGEDDPTCIHCGKIFYHGLPSLPDRRAAKRREPDVPEWLTEDGGLPAEGLDVA